MQRVENLKRRKWLWLLVLAGLILAWLVWQLNGPAVGTITRGTAKTRQSKPVATTYQQLKSKYIRLQLDGGYKATPVSSKTDLEVWKLNSKGLPFSTLAVVVTQPPFGPKESPALTYRQQHPELYSREARTVNSSTVSIFTAKSGSYEKSAFSIKGNLIASVALTSYQGSPSTLNQEFEQLITSFDWQ